MFAQEFEGNRILQWALGALIFVYFIIFNSWIGSSAITKEARESLTYVCPPHFQSCESFYIFHTLPEGYSHTLVYMVFFALFVWCAYLMSERRWRTVQYALIPAFLWHILHVFLITDWRSGNYEYYTIVFALILLFLPHKEFFLKLSLVFFYVLSTFAKIHPSWIEGAYFSALHTGLPFFPDWSIPLWTNLVILMEMIGAWFLFSQRPYLQRSILIFFIAFHLYSGILVTYRYPANVLPFLLILFGPWYRHTPIPLDRKSAAGWMLIVLLLIAQCIPRIIPGDEKLTLEGNKYGLYMFEANHQCISEAVVYFNSGSTLDVSRINPNARNRCAPYEYWFPLKNLCKHTPDIAHIKWKFTHSINGGPFYRIVDVEDACALTYHPFRHNDWIHTEEDAPRIGYPAQNFYR